MDTSEQYIKMCAALPAEFGEAWKPGEGDFIIATPISGEQFTAIISTYDRSPGLLAYLSVTDIKTKNRSAWYSLGEVTWLPRLDQLLNIITGDKNPVATISKLFIYEDRALADLYPNWRVPEITLEQLALTYIMYTDYRLLWYEGKWEPVE